MKYGGAYWNIKELLPYQRNFNFVNSLRNNGKTYTTLGFFIERFLNYREEFFYVLRTQDEKKSGAFGKAFEKVISKEFYHHEFTFSNDTCTINGIVAGHCRALSEAVKVKKESFPAVRWLVMDEYMLEQKHFDTYVKGWEEPNLFLNLYHTIDREEDRVICFLLGNNTAFYNPYHLHKAFDIPMVEPGKIWYKENVLFQWAVAKEERLEQQENCKFARMIRGTNYGSYALEGNYLGDNADFVAEKATDAILSFYIILEGRLYGVWSSFKLCIAYITPANNAGGSKYVFAIDKKDLTSNSRILTRDSSFYKWLKKRLINSAICYDSMETKLRVQPALYKIL